MGSYSGVVTCLWRCDNIIIYELSVSGMKVTAICKNWKNIDDQNRRLEFLVALGWHSFYCSQRFQELFTLQVIFQWIIIIILTSFDKNMLFQYRNLRAEFINSFGKVQMYWYLLWFLLNFYPLKHWKAGRISIFLI